MRVFEAQRAHQRLVVVARNDGQIRFFTCTAAVSPIFRSKAMLMKICTKAKRKLICAAFVLCMFTIKHRERELGFSKLTVGRSLWDAYLPATNTDADYCTERDAASLKWLRGIYSSQFARSRTTCDSLVRIGPKGDGGKMVCLDRIQKYSCVAYSLGSRLDFSFEVAVREYLGCEVYTFDCTVGNVSSTIVPTGVSFYPWCIGGREEKKIISSDFGHTGDFGQYYPLDTIMQKLKHNKVHLLKMDIERHEVAVIDSLKVDYAPDQLVFETHLHNAYGIWNRPLQHHEWLGMWTKLNTLGYRLFAYEPNPLCPCCCEWSAQRT